MKKTQVRPVHAARLLVNSRNTAVENVAFYPISVFCRLPPGAL